MEHAVVVAAPTSSGVNTLYIAIAVVVVVFAALTFLIGFPFVIAVADAAALLMVAFLAYLTSGGFGA